MILLDQFSRNLNRNSPTAFAADAHAEGLTLGAEASGHAAELRPIERAFLYMPLMHAEDARLQERGVELFEATRRAQSDDCKHFGKYARMHRDIVAALRPLPTPERRARSRVDRGGASVSRAGRNVRGRRRRNAAIFGRQRLWHDGRCGSVPPSTMLAAVTPIPGHAVFLLLIQLALLLIVARIGAALSRAVGLPAVVGELAAGIVLGPTVFGHYAPGAFAAVFPQTTEQFHLLETVGVLGIVLLLLLTGLETDLKLLRNLGRAAVVASVLGMLVPFVSGFGLGLWMPDEYLAQPDRRRLFASFLATSMAISAMPVIAKILMDLDLTRRNIGLVILSAGVVDDTAGWLVLSVIAGAATQGGGVQLAGLGMTIVFTGVFLVAMAIVAYPLLRFVMRLLSRAHSIDGEMVLIVSFTFSVRGAHREDRCSRGVRRVHRRDRVAAGARPESGDRASSGVVRVRDPGAGVLRHRRIAREPLVTERRRRNDARSRAADRLFRQTRRVHARRSLGRAQ